MPTIPRRPAAQRRRQRLEVRRLRAAELFAAGAHQAELVRSTDMAGLNRGRVPKLVKRYADLGGVLADAAVRFAADVRAGVYPDEEHSYN